MSMYSDRDEWLEADGLGGFASGTASGIRTRRYHALLLTATTPPTGRVVLVNGLDAWVSTPAGTTALSSQRYEPGVVHPGGAALVSRFDAEPWPTWIYRLEDGTEVEHALIARRGVPVVALSWRILCGSGDGHLSVRPFLSGRDYHSLHHENPSFRFGPDRDGQRLTWRPYDGIPAIHMRSNGDYCHRPDWYRDFRYEAERDRGLDSVEDLATPGVFTWELGQAEATLILAAGPEGAAWLDGQTDAAAALESVRTFESRRRRSFPTALHRAADAYVVARGAGKTIVAGYPWFTDWGRDTFIALRGICLAAGRIDEASRILLEWAEATSEGMLPNRFPDRGDTPEFNSVDASLWFVLVVHELFDAAVRAGTPVPDADRRRLEDAVDRILAGHAFGTRYGIAMDGDGLLKAGVPGVQLTWMDAKVGDHVVTPRIGKPVEVQALWLNALWLAGWKNPRWRELFERGRTAFEARFWNDATGTLHDVVDVDHRAGVVDPDVRPNQIFALGALPVTLVAEARARCAIDVVESRLWTPIGLRSLAADEPGYVGRYGGDVPSRDGAYHQGTVWPWLLTPFVEAWVRARGGGDTVVADARERFLAPMLRHLSEAGLGHVSEIADGDAPHAPNGCPFQAWSVGELLRLQTSVLASSPRASRNRRRVGASNGLKGAGRPLVFA